MVWIAAFGRDMGFRDAAVKLDRRASLSVEEFVESYLVANRPVIVTDAMADWRAFGRWTPDFFAETFGDEKVLIYNDLFMLIGVRTLRTYFERHFGNSGTNGDGRRPSYVRWYARSKDDGRMPWADAVFARLAEDWQLPYFLPQSDYLLPYCPPGATIDPSERPFPARGFFISGAGARTRLHTDPWASDAILCQMHGSKTFVMFDPDQAPLLTQGDKIVDIADPDRETFPEFDQARPTVEDCLKPGEMLLVPAGWYHHFDTVEDSISLTWNFVHCTAWQRFYGYLINDPPAEDLATVSYFLERSGTA